MSEEDLARFDTLLRGMLRGQEHLQYLLVISETHRSRQAESQLREAIRVGAARAAADPAVAVALFRRLADATQEET